MQVPWEHNKLAGSVSDLIWNWNRWLYWNINSGLRSAAIVLNIKCGTRTNSTIGLYNFNGSVVRYVLLQLTIWLRVAKRFTLRVTKILSIILWRPSAMSLGYKDKWGKILRDLERFELHLGVHLFHGFLNIYSFIQSLSLVFVFHLLIENLF